MARILNQIAGGVVEKYNDLTRDSAGVLTGPLNKLWRARIYLNRATSTLPKDTADKGKIYDPNNPFGPRATSKNPKVNQRIQNQYRMELKHRVEGGVPFGYEEMDPAKGNSVNKNKELFMVMPEVRNMNQVVIYNLVSTPYQYITLQNRPPSIDFRGETTWATIKSMGRNTPMYHYTGAEDIIQFNVSWFCNDPENPEEVITKCRLLEMWSKANSYQASPPILKIEWGNSGIFENHQYILTSATYTLNNFRNASRTRVAGKSCEIDDLKLLPAAATQELIFKRVSAYNLSYADIVNEETLKKTKGISL